MDLHLLAEQDPQPPYLLTSMSGNTAAGYLERVSHLLERHHVVNDIDPKQLSINKHLWIVEPTFQDQMINKHLHLLCCELTSI
jgi:hypothetical protein